MDGIHDLGGKHGYGQVVRRPNQPVFQGRWEARVFAIMVASSMAGAWRNTDRFRHLIERIDPAAYLTHGYYGRWLGGIETGLVEAGIVSQEDINARVAELSGDPEDLIAARPSEDPDPLGDPPFTAGSIRAVTEPRFSIGQQVVTSTQVKPGHTRLPAYARGKTGTIILLHGGWIFPDTNAHGRGENPQHLYTVQFAGSELWGNEDDSVKVSLDLFEPYLSEPQVSQGEAT